MAVDNNTDKTVPNAVKLVGDSIIPGSSLLIDGQLLAGAGHFLVGGLARTALGPLGFALVAANSYVRSTTGQGILKHLKKAAPAKQEAKPEAKAEEPAAAK